MRLFLFSNPRQQTGAEALSSRIRAARWWNIKIDERNVKSVNLIRACEILLCNICDVCASDRGKVKTRRRCSGDCEHRAPPLTSPQYFPGFLASPPACHHRSLWLVEMEQHIFYIQERCILPGQTWTAKILNPLQRKASLLPFFLFFPPLWDSKAAIFFQIEYIQICIKKKKRSWRLGLCLCLTVVAWNRFASLACRWREWVSKTDTRGGHCRAGF